MTANSSCRWAQRRRRTATSRSCLNACLNRRIRGASSAPCAFSSRRSSARLSASNTSIPSGRRHAGRERERAGDRRPGRRSAKLPPPGASCFTCTASLVKRAGWRPAPPPGRTPADPQPARPLRPHSDLRLRNLHTPIEENARLLRQRLADAGLGPNMQDAAPRRAFHGRPGCTLVH